MIAIYKPDDWNLDNINRVSEIIMAVSNEIKEEFAEKFPDTGE